MNATYVYDMRTQMLEPVVVIYDETLVAHITHLLSADHGPVPKEHQYITRIRMHPYDKDRYEQMGSQAELHLKRKKNGKKGL